MAFFDRFRNKPTNLENWYVDNNKFAKDAYQSEKETIEKLKITLNNTDQDERYNIHKVD